MRNPWLKKNPFLSMYLSGANRVAGTLRSQAGATAKREAAKAGSTATRELLRWWSDALTPLAPPKKPRKPH